MNLVFILPFLFIIFGCHRPGKVEAAIVTQIRRCPVISTCQISLRSVTDFDFDEMYAFDLTTNPRDRERVLGVKDDGFVEMERQLVFMKGGKIMHQENEPTNIEGVVENQVIFDAEAGDKFEKYPSGARFSIFEERSEGRRFFALKQLDSNSAHQH